jgi:hypothetical protein
VEQMLKETKIAMSPEYLELQVAKFWDINMDTVQRSKAHTTCCFLSTKGVTWSQLTKAFNSLMVANTTQSEAVTDYLRKTVATLYALRKKSLDGAEKEGNADVTKMQRKQKKQKKQKNPVSDDEPCAGNALVLKDDDNKAPQKKKQKKKKKNPPPKECDKIGYQANSTFPRVLLGTTNTTATITSDVPPHLSGYPFTWTNTWMFLNHLHRSSKWNPGNVHCTQVAKNLKLACDQNPEIKISTGKLYKEWTKYFEEQLQSPDNESLRLSVLAYQQDNPPAQQRIDPKDEQIAALLKQVADLREQNCTHAEPTDAAAASPEDQPEVNETADDELQITGAAAAPPNVPVTVVKQEPGTQTMPMIGHMATKTWLKKIKEYESSKNRLIVAVTVDKHVPHDYGDAVTLASRRTIRQMCTMLRDQLSNEQKANKQVHASNDHHMLATHGVGDGCNPNEVVKDSK